jgi:hypothetical protein
MNKCRCMDKTRKSKAQLEMIGLVIIVIIVVTGLLIYLVYKLSNPTENIQRTYMNKEIATNFLTAAVKTTVNNCNGQKLEELITDCARPSHEKSCYDYTSCEMVNKTINEILSKTLIKWGVSFNLSIATVIEGSAPETFMNFASQNCSSRNEKIEGFEILSLYPVSGTAELKLDICTK